MAETRFVPHVAPGEFEGLYRLEGESLFTVDLYPAKRQPGWSAWRLALVTVMQYMENLTDRQAAEAVRARLDWKYALGLRLDDAGFDYSVLSEFRQRLLRGGKEGLLLERILQVAEEGQLLEGKAMQCTDATYVLARIRRMNRLEIAGEAVRRVLDDVAVIAPDWLREHMPRAWVECYGRPFDNVSPAQEQAEAEGTGGSDGKRWLCVVRSHPVGRRCAGGSPMD